MWPPTAPEVNGKNAGPYGLPQSKLSNLDRPNDASEAIQHLRHRAALKVASDFGGGSEGGFGYLLTKCPRPDATQRQHHRFFVQRRRQEQPSGATSHPILPLQAQQFYGPLVLFPAKGLGGNRQEMPRPDRRLYDQNQIGCRSP